jgi:hypothetical protein
MLRLAAALLVRLGLVMLVLAALVRLVPMPDQADVMADDFAIALSLVLVLAPAFYLRLTRDASTEAGQPKTPKTPKTPNSLTSRHDIRR